MASRFVIGLCGLVLVCAMHLRPRDDAPHSIALLAWLTPGTWHVIPVDSDRAAFDLAGSDRQRYLLIVSSLGDATKTLCVRLEAEPIARPQAHGVACEKSTRLAPWGRGVGGEGSARRENLEFLAVRGTGVPPVQTAGPTVSAPSRQSSPLRGEGGANPCRAFDIHVGPGSYDDAASYARVTGRVASESESVRVFLDQQQPFDQTTQDTADEIASLLESRIIPRCRELLGTHADVDGDGKLAVLLTRVLDRVSAGQSLGGFVRASDFRREASPPFGSHADVIYLNSQVVSRGEHLHTLLAHEYTHAVCFSERWRREATGKRVPDEEDWLTESIAHVAEQRHHAGWSNLDHRIARYLRDPASAPLVVPDAARAGLWRDPGCRGASYLFLQWCVDQFGDDFLRDLIHSPHRGRANIEHAAGVPFAELFRRWSIAVWEAGRTESRDDIATGGYRSLSLHGRLGDVTLSGPTTTAWCADPSPPTPLPQGARGAVLELKLRGTAMAFVQLHAPADGQPRRITVAADSGTDLQLTLIPLAAEDSSSVLVAESPAGPR